MKVVLSVYPISKPLTGIGRYTWELASGLKCRREISELYLLNMGRWVGDLDKLLVESTAASLKKTLAGSNVATSIYQRVSPVLFRSRLKGYSDCIYHSPNFMLPPFPGKTITTFHDLSVFRFPEYHRDVHVRLMEKEIENALDQADRVIAISEFTKNEITDLFGYPGDRVAVVPNGVSQAFYPRAEGEFGSTLRAYGLRSGRYFLSVATIEPRKNIDSILDAYEFLPKNMQSEYPLVICGTSGWKSESTMDRIENMSRTGNVRYLGFVGEEDKPLLYAGATAIVFIPFYEGFGLPVLEAMASGTPIVASDIPPHKEVSGRSSYTVDPCDCWRLSKIMSALTCPDENTRRKITLGLKRAKGFSWENTIEKTVLQYQEVDGKPNGMGACN